MKYVNSLNIALDKILSENKDAFLIGEDIADPYGGAFKVTKNLTKKHKKKVFSTPISEAAITGVASGLAIKGHKVILELMFGDFLALAIDQIHNGISKTIKLKKDFNFGSLTIRTPMGGYRGYGCTHSQSTETILMNTPNLNIYSPNIFINPGDLLIKAVNKQKLSLFVEHKLSYSKDVKVNNFKDLDLIIEEYENFCKVKLFDSDPKFTIITYGFVSQLALESIYNFFINHEIAGEIIVFSKIKSIDTSFTEIIQSNSVITLEEGVAENGWGKLISSDIYKKLLNKLEKPIVNIGSKNTILPSSLKKELEILPNIKQIEEKIGGILK